MTKHIRPTLGRLFLITGVSISLFLGVSGFIPLPQEDQSTDKTTAENSSFASDLMTINSHNLVVDTEELRCLALNIYFEARSEPLSGQLAVAGVTMNRVASSKFPDTICNVVKQGSEVRLHRCQFSWWCDGKRDIPKEAQAWANAQQLARLFLAGIYNDPTEKALWYHADYVNPDWAQRMTKTAKIGRHVFYRAKERTQVALF